MKKNPLIGVGIIAGVLLVLGSLSNVVGYQTVQSSNQKVIKDEVDQKELLFQTILDIANNYEIQRVILDSEIRRGGFFNPDTRFSVFTPHVLNKAELNIAYHIGLIFSRILVSSRIHPMLEQYQVSNQALQKEITVVIEKDAILKGEITQLSNSKCDCENISGVTSWPFPVICLIADIMALIGLFLALTLGCGDICIEIAGILIEIFNCPGWS
jgi:hypothetical protein